MASIEDFNAIFGSAPDLAYQQKTVEEIHKNRRQLENCLFFDRLLKAVGIDQVSKLHPPRSNVDLRSLHNGIIKSSSPDHHKQSLVYYIMKDLPLGLESAENFATECYLPSKYRIFIDGIWHLDRLQCEEALDYLTEPCLIPTFPEEILYTLCKHTPSNQTTLPLAYYYTVSPPITSSHVLDALFTTVCSASVTEAYHFLRNYGESTHRYLFEQLITFVHAHSGGEMRAARSVDLIGLPFDDDEEQWLEAYLVDGKGKGLYGAKDTVMMRKIATRRTQEAVEFGKHMSGRKMDGVNWASLRAGLQHGTESQHKATSGISHAEHRPT